MAFPRLARLATVIVVLIRSFVFAFAQQIPLAEHNGEFLPVKEVHDGMPYVEDHGKVVRAVGRRVELQSVLAFTPVYVSIKDVDAHASALSTGGGATLNNVFHYSAYFESSYALKNVFVLLDLTLAEAGHTYLMWDVGDLQPYQSQRVELNLPVSGEIGSGQYLTHVFVDGNEVFNSTMGSQFVERTLDEMVASRVAAVAQARATPFVGPFPKTPAGFGHKTGRALIRCTITPQGRVVDPEVRSTTSPELAAAALDAARQWRFLPKVVDGRAVESNVIMPFDFPTTPRGR